MITVELFLSKIYESFEKLEKEQISEKKTIFAEGLINLGNISIGSLFFSQFLDEKVNPLVGALGATAGIIFYLSAILLLRRRL
ncbi:MAG TPA: hypothetical protein VF209_02595 [Patescibacteria group bacterium]